MRCLNNLFWDLQTAKSLEDLSLSEYSSRGRKKKNLKIRLDPLLKATQKTASANNASKVMKPGDEDGKNSPASGEEQPHAQAQAGQQLAGKELYRQGHGRPGGPAEHSQQRARAAN